MNTFEISPKGELVAYNGNENIVAIPYGVTSIGKEAFKDNPIKMVVIPSSVVAIDDLAFYSCERLTDVIIPDSVTSIGNMAFDGCTGLTSITIPDSVTSIGNGAFGNCTGLTSITIPDSVTSIGNGAFIDCTGLTSITIPDSVTSIGYSAFLGCTNCKIDCSANAYAESWCQERKYKEITNHTYLAK